MPTDAPVEYNPTPEPKPKKATGHEADVLQARGGGQPADPSTLQQIGTGIRGQYQSLVDDWYAKQADVQAYRAENPSTGPAASVGQNPRGIVAPTSPVSYDTTVADKTSEILGYSPDDVAAQRGEAMGEYRQIKTLDKVAPEYIDERLAPFDPRVVELAPDTVFRAAFHSQASGKEYERQAQAVSQSILWVMGKDKMGLEDGALSAARLYATNTGNKSALEFLKIVQTLPVAQQDALLRQLRDPNAQILDPNALLMPSETGQAAPVSSVPGWTAEEIQALTDAGNTLHTKYGLTSVVDDQGNVQYSFPNEDKSVDLVAGIKELFPNNAAMFSVAGPDGWQDISASLDVSPGVKIDGEEVGGPARFLGVPIPGIGPAAKGANIALAAGSKPFEWAGELYKHTMDALYRAADEHGPHLGLIDSGKSKAIAAGISGSPVQIFNEGFSAFDKAVHLPVDAFVDHAITGVDESTKDEIKGAFAGFAELFILNRASEASRAAKTSRTMLPEDARAQLGIDKPLGQTSFGSPRSPLPDTAAFHPFEATKNIAKRVGYELAGYKTINDAMKSRVVQKNFDWVERINDKYSTHEQRTAAIRNLWGDSMPVALADRLAETSRGEMAAAFIDYAERGKRTGERVRTLQASIKSHNAILADVADRAKQEDLAQRVINGSREVERLRTEASPEADVAETQFRQDAIELTRNAQLAAETRLLKAADEHALLNLAGDLNGVPVYEYPHASTVKRFFRDQALGGLAHRVADNFFVRPMRDVSLKLVDEISNHATLYSPEVANKPLDWIENNVDAASAMFDRLKFDDTVKKQLVGELAAVKTRSDFYAWKDRAQAAVKDALPKHLPADVVEELTNWSRSEIESRGQLFVTAEKIGPDGAVTRTSEPIIPGHDPRDPTAPRTIALPSSPNEFLGGVTLPRADLLIEASSNIRKAIRFGKRHRWTGGFLIEAPYHIFRGVTSAFTTALKAPILGLRIPAMATRVQSEQALRAHFYGGYKGMVNFPGGLIVRSSALDYVLKQYGRDAFAGFHVFDADPRYVDFTPPNEMSLGGIHQQLAGNGTTTYHAVETTLLNNRDKLPNKAHYQAVAEGLEKLNGNYFDKALARNGLDADKMLSYIAETEKFKDFIDQQILPQLRESALNAPPKADEVLVRDFIDRRIQGIKELTNNDPAKIEAINTGVYRRGARGAYGIDPTNGLSWEDSMARKLDEVSLIHDRLRNADLPLTNDEALALHAQSKQLRAEMEDIRTRRGVSKDAAAAEKPIDLKDTSKVRAAIEKEYLAREYNFPQTISVKRRYSDFEGQGARESLAQMRQAWNNFWYTPFKALSWSDIHGTRGSVYYQMADHYRRGLMERGYSEAKATAFAEIKAAAQTRDLMYDLSARSSSERALKDTMWFAPAAKEAMYTWGVKIPSQYWGGTGYALGYAKAKVYLNLMRSLGVVTQNAQGEDVVSAPIIGDFIDKLVGSSYGSSISMNLRGFNLVAASPIPSLNPSLAYMLSKEGREHGGVLRKMSEVFNGRYQDVQFVPRQVSALYEAVTGKSFPFEWMSPDFARAQSDRAMDQAIQWAFSDHLSRGDVPPRPDDFKTKEAYVAAYKTYMDSIMGDGRDYFQAVAWKRFAGATVTPASLQITEQERSDWQKFFNDVIDPLGDEEKTGSYTEAQRNAIDTYISQHPYSLAYTVGYTAYGDKKVDLPYTPAADQEFYEKLYTGEARVLTPEEFAKKLLSVESYRFYNSQREAAMAGIDKDAPTLLTHGYEKATALAGFTSEWNKYLAYNPDTKALLDDARQQWASKYGIPQQTYETERTANTIEYLNEMSGYFTGESGMRSTEYRAVLGQLKAMYTDQATFGKPTTQMGRDLNWYYNNVLDPYFTQTQDLYDQANTLSAAGQDAGALYDQIRAINNSIKPQVHNGQTFPTPEEVFFGNKNPVEQQAAINNWRSKPPTWLTDFQLDKAGVLPQFEGRDTLLSDLSRVDAQVSKIITDNAISTSSTDYQNLQVQADRARAQIAAPYGSNGAAVLAAVNGTPLDRMTAAGYGAGQLDWQNMANAARQIGTGLEGAGLSARGWGADAARYKIQLYATINQLRSTSPEFDALWTNMSDALPDSSGRPREGAPLYDAVLYGNFSTPIPSWAIQQIG